MKRVTIDECTEGYNVKEDGTENIYAVTKEGLIKKVKELLGITEKKPPKKKIIPEKIPSTQDDLPMQKNLLSKKIIVKDNFPCEKFDISNLPAKKLGKSTYWLSEDGQKTCIGREGYAPGLYVYVTLDDLKYLYEHQDETKSISKTRRYHISGFLKDATVLFENKQLKEPPTTQKPKELSESKEQEIEFEEPESGPEQEPEPEKQKPLIEAFQEDGGFDYMAVQPKWVGKVQVYTNIYGKMVIKENKAIILTTNQMIEKLVPLDETDLNRCIRGITHVKQKILRNYLTALRMRGGY